MPRDPPTRDRAGSPARRATQGGGRARCANIRDGSGVTAGRAGFTTSDGDALKVTEAYTIRSPDNPLSRFIPELRRLEDPTLLRSLNRRSEQPRSR
ncbi:chitosanase [Streptomyces sp. NBC_01207]|uniref:chitosanase n=1 Tax=Streptomyces sp. NBC_01207 TaxID=2903772 RepID=UPI003FA36A09